MISFKDIQALVMELDINAIRVLDYSENKVMEFTGKASEVVDYLQSKSEILKSYQRVKINAATDSQKKQNWTNCYSWNVHFQEIAKTPAAPPTMQQPMGNIPAGYISQDHAMLLAQVQLMNVNLENFKKEMEWERKFSEATNNDPMRYAPLAGMFMDIDDKKMANMMKMFQLQSAMNGKPGLAGAPAANGSKLTFAGTTEETAAAVTQEDEAKLVAQLEQHMIKVRDAIGYPKLLTLTSYLANNPGMADTLLTMIPKS